MARAVGCGTASAALLVLASAALGSWLGALHLQADGACPDVEALLRQVQQLRREVGEQRQELSDLRGGVGGKREASPEAEPTEPERTEPETSAEAYLTAFASKVGVGWKGFFWPGLFAWIVVWWHWLAAPVARRYEVVSKYHLCALMVFGMNVAVLSMFQRFGSLGGLGLVVMSGLNSCGARWRFSEVAPVKESQFEATNVYQNLDFPIGQLAVIFVGQTTLLIFLGYSTYHSFKQTTEDSAFVFWFAGFFAVQMSGYFKRGSDSQVGRPWDPEKWRGLMARNQAMEQTPTMQYKGAGEPFRKSQSELQWRGLMGFFVNTFYREVIMFITPILCMQSGNGVEFVQNCFALSYITTIDDMSEPKTFIIVDTAPPPEHED